MLELIVAASVLAGLLVMASRRRPNLGSADGRSWSPEPDLPCPWCRAATREDDRACPSCGRSFGQPAT